MERAAWAILSALNLADKLQFIVGALFILWLWFETRGRK
jgi:hypothetical protein